MSRDPHVRDPWFFQRWAFHASSGSPARKAVLSMLAMLADANTGRCEAKQETLAKGVETSERTVREHLRALEATGLIARRAQFRADRGRRGDEYLLLAPGVAEWPDGTPVQPADSSGGGGRNQYPPRGIESSGQEQPLKNNHSLEERSRASEPANNTLPNTSSLSPEVRRVVDVVEPVLRRVAAAKGAIAVAPRSVATLVERRLNKPHDKATEAFEHYWVHGAGRHKPVRDTVAAYRNWVDREPDLEPRANTADARGVSSLEERRARGVAALRRLQGREG